VIDCRLFWRLISSPSSRSPKTAPLRFCLFGSKLSRRWTIQMSIRGRGPSHTATGSSGSATLPPPSSAPRISPRSDRRLDRLTVPSSSFLALHQPSLAQALPSRRRLATSTLFPREEFSEHQSSRMKSSTESPHGPPLTAEHYRQYRKQIAAKGTTKRAHATSTKNAIRYLKVRMKR
jgi:hypothetical protein